MRRNRPAVDRAIASESRLTRDGQPISYNRAPAPDLSPWVARFYVTKVAAPDDHVVSCGLFNDAAFLRVQLAGKWHAETLRGPLDYARKALFFGPHSRRMPITVTGGFVSVGVALRPGACHALKGPNICEHVDCIVPIDEVGGSEEAIFDAFDPDAGPEEWVGAMEEHVRQLVERRGARRPDPVSAAFEAQAFADPGIEVARFAATTGIDQRRLQRIVRRDFGMPPKQVLRRARALDMASHLRGVADRDEADVLALRYYDQSHLIREFTALFGMSPSQFVSTPQPLMTAALETRQARRLEMIDRIAPGEIRPWE